MFPLRRPIRSKTIRNTYASTYRAIASVTYASEGPVAHRFETRFSDAWLGRFLSFERRKACREERPSRRTRRDAPSSPLRRRPRPPCRFRRAPSHRKCASLAPTRDRDVHAEDIDISEQTHPSRYRNVPVEIPRLMGTRYRWRSGMRVAHAAFAWTLATCRRCAKVRGGDCAHRKRIGKERKEDLTDHGDDGGTSWWNGWATVRMVECGKRRIDRRVNGWPSK